MEVVNQTVGNIMGKMVDFVFGEVGKQFGYLINYHTHVNTLTDGARNLKNKRKALRGRTEAATRNLEEIEPEVETWFKDVDPLISETESFLEADRARNNHRCINGKCINLWSRYKSGKEACKKATKISKYQDIEFASVSHPVPPPEIKPVSSTTIFSGIESRRSILKDIMEALDDASINVIGICGMGGVGKTTIVEEVCRQAAEKKCFDVVAMAVVSHTPDLTMIQDKIACKLGLKLPSQDESERAKALWKRIEDEKKILIILDDAWSRLELTKIGIPFGSDHTGCKIVLTSRSEDVCNEMDAQKIFRIQGLLGQEAWELFRKIVGDDIDSPELISVAREIVGGCCGLPLAIVTVGGALKKRSKKRWIDVAAQLKRPVPAAIGKVEQILYPRLKLSYEYLDCKEAKSLFLLCSLFPEDSFISIELLLKYGIGLMLFKNVDTIEDARVRVAALVDVLLSSFLLLKVEDHTAYVKMHDVVRDVAILIASEEENQYLVKAGCELKEWPTSDPTFENCRGISLVRNGIHEFPDELKCPKLQILLLNELELQPPFEHKQPTDFGKQSMDVLRMLKLACSKDKKIPVNFFQGMKDLKVLDMSGYSVLPSLPTSVTMLTTLQTLVLDRCILGASVSIIGTLKQLEILSLCDSDITVVPEHFSQLTRMKVLDLTGCALEQIPRGVISNLGKLEEMYIPQFINWAAKKGEEDSRSSVSLSELNSLYELTSLSFSAEQIDIFPVGFKFQNLKRFEINIAFHSGLPFLDWWQAGSGLSLLRKKMRLLECDMRSISGPMEVLLKEVEGLHLHNCRNLENIIQGRYSHILNELKLLEIKNSHEMEYLVDMVNWATEVVFPNVHFLGLYGLHNLRGICNGHVPLPAESFSKLTRLQLINCDSMLNVAESNLLRCRFQCLQHLFVSSCGNLLNVFDFEGLAIEGEDADSLSWLEMLELWDLPNLMHVWKTTRHFVNLCNLKSVVVEGCDELRQLFPPSLLQGLVHLETVDVHKCNSLEQIFQTDCKEEEGMEIVNEVEGISLRTSTSLQCLTEVKLRKCERLRRVFHPSLVKGLVQLKALTLESCEMIEAVIEDDERGVLEETVSSSIEKITFPLLHSIKFYGMDNLSCFCMGRFAVEYPSLEVVSIVKCPRMETFGHGVQITPKLKEVLHGEEEEEEEEEESWMGDLEIWMGDEESRMGYLKSWMGDEESPMGDEESPMGDLESWMGDLNSTVQHLCRKRRKFNGDPADG